MSVLLLCSSAVFYCIYLSSLSRLSLFLTLSRNKVVIYFCALLQNHKVKPSTTYELPDGTIIKSILPADDGEDDEPVSALYQSVAMHTDLLANVYEGWLH